MGRTPDVSPGVDWVGAPFRYDSVDGHGTFNNATSNSMVGIELPGTSYFSTNPGIYELSVDLTLTSGSGTAWFSIGFSEVMNTATNRGFYQANTSNEGLPWLFLRENGEGNFRSNGGTTVATVTGQSVVATSLKLTLDTTVTNWTVAASIGGAEMDLNGTDPGKLFTFSSNPTDISAVGFTGGSGLVSNQFDNFSLVQVPEPTAYALMFAVFTGAVVLVRRRHRKAHS